MNKVADKLRELASHAEANALRHESKGNSKKAKPFWHEHNLLNAVTDVIEEMSRWRDLPDPLVSELQKAEEIARGES